MLNVLSHCYHGAFSYFPGHVASSSLSSSPTVFIFFSLNAQGSKVLLNSKDSVVLSEYLLSHW